jgi:hypothetical protein
MIASFPLRWKLGTQPSGHVAIDWPHSTVSSAGVHSQPSVVARDRGRIRLGDSHAGYRTLRATSPGRGPLVTKAVTNGLPASDGHPDTRSAERFRPASRVVLSHASSCTSLGASRNERSMSSAACADHLRPSRVEGPGVGLAPTPQPASRTRDARPTAIRRFTPRPPILILPGRDSRVGLSSGSA